MKLLSTGETARLIGVPAHKITYAFSSNRLPEPRRVLGRRAFGKRDIERLAKHFGIVLPGSDAGKEAK
jgi:DNA-binding transcriptional MerR regulator